MYVLRNKFLSRVLSSCRIVFLFKSSKQAVAASVVINRKGCDYNASLRNIAWIVLTSGLICEANVSADDTGISDVKSHRDENDGGKYYRRSEVEKYVTIEKGVWVTFKDGVYDVTEFLANHPGGKDKIMSAAGKDLSELWKIPAYQQHFKSPLAFELLAESRIGSLHPNDIISSDDIQLEKSQQKYSSSRIYDCIVVGSGVSGLQCAYSLTNQHGVARDNVLILEAQDYVGGRVRQVSDFVSGVNIDVGAEFLHGAKTLLTAFAHENNEKLTELFCWAHGDGGPLPEAVGKGYGLYYLGDSGSKRLLRYDDVDVDFVHMNEALWEIANLDPSDYSDSHSLFHYLSAQGFSEEMMDMASGGFANTLCTNSKDLSLRQCIIWCKLWNGESSDDDGDFYFNRSYKCIIDHFKKNLQIEVNSPVSEVHYPHVLSEVDGNSNAGLVKLVTKEGVEYVARSAVITASPHVLKTELIQFFPPLSNEVKEALDTVNMYNIVKVILKFSEPVWPKDLHGMIMTDKNFLLPEVWFRTVKPSGIAQKAGQEPASAYCIGFTTADYAEKIRTMSKKEVLSQCVGQLEQVFSKLEPRHMAADVLDEDVQLPGDLPKASDAYLGGMFWDWNPEHHPYIGGGYCSPKVNTSAHLISILREPYGAPGCKHILCFAGEATNLPGATAHAALESGVRAAAQISSVLQLRAKYV